MQHVENRAAFVTRHLARRLLSIFPGERIPTTSDIAGELGVGFGTVEKAIVALRDGKVIKTRARGQMGTFLLERDLPRQWVVAGLGAAVGLLPIPNSMLFVGLATGITKWFETTGVPFTLNFKNGGRSRVSALVDGRADFVVVSGRTAELVCAQYDTLLAAFSLPERSYYAGHHIISRADLAKQREDWVIRDRSDLLRPCLVLRGVVSRFSQARGSLRQPSLRHHEGRDRRDRRAFPVAPAA